MLVSFIVTSATFLCRLQRRSFSNSEDDRLTTTPTAADGTKTFTFNLKTKLYFKSQLI